MRARQAVGVEYERLWAGFRDYEGDKTDLDELAKLRPGHTALIVLEPS